jgi:hypothetical protein
MRRPLLAIIFALCITSGLRGQIVYQTGFDSAPFINGDLFGQDGWTSTNNPPTLNRALVQSSLSLSAPRAVRLDASLGTSSDWFWKPVNFNVPLASGPLIQIQWDMFIDNSAATQSSLWGIDVYDTTSLVPRRVTAVAVDSNDAILAWNGSSFSSTGVITTNSAWHHFKMNMDYVGLRVSLYYDGVRVSYSKPFSTGVNGVLGDADLYHVDGGGSDKTYFDNLSIVALPDGDHDGVPDAEDFCAATPSGNTVDANGCSSVDDDLDGVPNDGDQCPNTPPCAAVNAVGCPSDSDGDGVFNGCDNCPTTSNNGQSDGDGDGEGDACDLCPNRRPGDVSGNGLVNGADIAKFIAIVRGGASTADEHCACDINEDGFVTVDDVAGFTNVLLNP